MKDEFVVYNSVTYRKKVTIPPTVRFSHKGVMSINPAAIRLIGLKHGDQIRLLQNKHNPKEWFIEKVNTEGFKLRKALINNREVTLLANSQFTCKAIQKALEISESFKVVIGSEPDENGRWSLITSAVKTGRL
jgi:hypothetical protein